MKKTIALFLCLCLLTGCTLLGTAEENNDILGYWTLDKVEGDEEVIRSLLQLLATLKQYDGSIGYEFEAGGTVNLVLELMGQKQIDSTFSYTFEGSTVTLYSSDSDAPMTLLIDGDTMTGSESSVTEEGEEIGYTMTFVRQIPPVIAEPMDIDPAMYPIATITMQGGGQIVLELYPDKAPNTVANFIVLANSGFYDGVIFHRVISGFMIQGGDPLGTGTGGPGYNLYGEFSQNGYTANDLKHERGVISMARANPYNSAGSQFFIMHADAAHLDGAYAAFGRVLSGMEVVDAIAGVSTNASNRPDEEQVIESIRVDTKGIEYSVNKIGG